MSPKQSLFDVHEIHEVPPLVASPSLDSASSNSIPSSGSPTLLLVESLVHDVPPSFDPLHGTPTVKFAPLPQMDPNRKRSLAPLGASARSRRKRVIQQEGGSLLWSLDPDVQEEDMEDPIVAFAKLVKRASKTLWRSVRQGGHALPREDMSHASEPVLDISPTIHPSDIALGERMSEVVGGEDKQRRRASWSPPAARRTLSLGRAKRKSTSDMRSSR